MNKTKQNMHIRRRQHDINTHIYIEVKKGPFGPKVTKTVSGQERLGTGDIDITAVEPFSFTLHFLFHDIMKNESKILVFHIFQGHSYFLVSLI